MRNIIIILFMLLAVTGTAQVTVFSESFGTTSVNTSASTYTGYQHYGEQTYTGNASIRNTLPSTGYAGASGNANVYFPTTVGTSITVSGINTYCYLYAFLSVGIWKSSTSSNGSEFTVEYSDNGGSWVPMSFTLPTGAGTAIWRNVTLTDYLPLTTNLSLKFTQTSSSVIFRIDDINIAGIQNATDTFISNCTGFVYKDVLYTQDSLYVFTEYDYKGCDSLVRVEYLYDASDPNCILPVELVEFKGQQITNIIQLSWKTLSERNSKVFSIEKLINNNWVSLIKLTAAGRSISPIVYQYDDQSPVEGTNYYRLKQIDFDGRFTLSDIIVVKFSSDYLNSTTEYYDVLGQKVNSFVPNQIYIKVSNGKAKQFIYIQ